MFEIICKGTDGITRTKVVVHSCMFKLMDAYVIVARN